MNVVDAKKILGDVILEEGKKNSNVVVVSTDSANRSGLTDFIDSFPERYYELGIMEQAAVGVSSGLATAGKIPVFVAPAMFVTGRPFEFFRIDLGYMKQNAKMIGRNCGINYSDLGPTHHGLEDIALIRLIPGVVILAPQDAGELEGALHAMMEYEGPVYLRVSTAPIAELFEKVPFKIGEGRMIRDGKDVTIITTGEITANVMGAVDILTEQGYDPQVIGMPTVQPIDAEMIKAAAAKTGKIVTVEEHFKTGGLGSAVAEICSEYCPVPVKRIAMPDAYNGSGTYKDMILKFKLDAAGIAESIQEFLK